MITVTYEHNDAMFRLRARILHQRWGWNVSVVDGMEMDVLDHGASPLYLLYTEDSALCGCCRLLPTTGPTMLNRFFADDFKEQLTAPTIWECSKFCLSEDIYNRGYFAIGHAAAIMLIGIARVAWPHGIRSITGIIDEKISRLYGALGVDTEILEQARINGRQTYSIVYHLKPKNLLDQAALEWKLADEAA